MIRSLFAVFALALGGLLVGCGGGACSELAAQCAACSDTGLEAACEAIVDTSELLIVGGDEACQSYVDNGTFEDC